MTFRTYDATIGRFLQVDPLEEMTPNWTPYRFGFNNPLRFSDSSGLTEDEDKKKRVNGGDEVERSNSEDGVRIGYASNDEESNESNDECCPGGIHPMGLERLARARAAENGNDFSDEYLGLVRNYHDSQDDVAIESILAISGEWAIVKTIQGGRYVYLAIKAHKLKYSINFASKARTTHILAGDATGGGHYWFGSLKSLWNGITGAKTMFPITWDARKIMHATSEVLTSNSWIQQTGKAGANFTKSGKPVRYKIEGTYEGVKIRVIATGNDIITAFPFK